MSNIIEHLEKTAQQVADEARRDQQAAEHAVEQSVRDDAPHHQPTLPQATDFTESRPPSDAAPEKSEQPPAPITPTVVAPAAPARSNAVQAYHDTLRYLWLAAFVIVIAHGLPFAAAIWMNSAYAPSIFVIVAAMGSLGAFISALMRLFNYRAFAQVYSADHASVGRLRKLFYALVPLLMGAVAGPVAYLLFASGMMRGAVFPEFGCTADGAGCMALNALLVHFGPTTAADFAKTLVWCFLAGFSERLLPDLIGNFYTAERTPGA